ncbi:MAG: imidazole glycerol phosphate synthase subunit HisH [Holophaga sp.]|nr:imidazole glycerol phosphate synthase subunit HisH [Holophaga sp.]
MIGILDYGCGNLRSLENALEFLGLESCRVGTPEAIKAVDRLIQPGVGHFGYAMTQLRKGKLEDPVQDFATSGRPLLGICLGMQLMFQGSEEAPEVPGLGLLPGRFEPFTDPTLKVPHMGWSTVEFQDTEGPAYFVHSFFLPEWNLNVPHQGLGIAQHGRPFVAAFRSGNLAGCQFHPEKSGIWGLKLLKEMLTW